DLVAVHPGHHRVQQNEAGALVERLLQCLLAVLGRDHLKAFETQVDLAEADDVFLVVGDEHYLAHVALLLRRGAFGGVAGLPPRRRFRRASRCTGYGWAPFTPNASYPGTRRKHLEAPVQAGSRRARSSAPAGPDRPRRRGRLLR